MTDNKLNKEDVEIDLVKHTNGDESYVITNKYTGKAVDAIYGERYKPKEKTHER